MSKSICIPRSGIRALHLARLSVLMDLIEKFGVSALGWGWAQNSPQPCLVDKGIRQWKHLLAALSPD